ncbi:MAG: hypothetical protein M0Z40_13160 [Actinomycetota bacterium]|nr:hypothetical protein [Actinomycetota bacterium]
MTIAEVNWLFENLHRLGTDATTEFVEGATKRLWQLTLGGSQERDDYRAYVKSWVVSARLACSEDWQEQVGAVDDSAPPDGRYWATHELSDLLRL